MNVTDVLEALAHLNADLYNKCPDGDQIEDVEATLRTDGEVFAIHFLGTCIWSSDVDELEPGQSLYDYLTTQAAMRIVCLAPYAIQKP